MAAMAAMAAVLKSRLSETSVNIMRQPVDIDGALRRGLEGSRPVTRDGPTLDRGTSTLDGQNPWMSLDITGYHWMSDESDVSFCIFWYW